MVVGSCNPRAGDEETPRALGLCGQQPSQPRQIQEAREPALNKQTKKKAGCTTGTTPQVVPWFNLV